MKASADLLSNKVKRLGLKQGDMIMISSLYPWGPGPFVFLGWTPRAPFELPGGMTHIPVFYSSNDVIGNVLCLDPYYIIEDMLVLTYADDRY